MNLGVGNELRTKELCIPRAGRIIGFTCNFPRQISKVLAFFWQARRGKFKKVNLFPWKL